MDNPQSESTAPPESDPSVSLDTLPLHSTDLLTVLDTDGTVQYESPSVTRLFGYDQGKLVGQSLADYIHPDDRQRGIESFQRLVEADDRTVESVEYRHEMADGTYLWVESVGASTPTPEGYYVINTRDISAQKRREQELEAATERLEQFTRFVSHDLQSPLTVARGNLTLAARDTDSEHHEAIGDALDRMEMLIDRLLADAHDEELTVNRQPVDLSTLCETCWQHVETEESELDATIDQSIKADRFRLKQLLENCFSNAVKHNDDPVRISVGELDDGFYIADDGSGITDADREQVFETGYTTAETGSGFGLEIVSHVADAHDWEVDLAESSAGGARFEITDVEFAAAESN